MTKRTKRRVLGALLVVGLIVVALFGRPAFYIARAMWRDRDDIAALPPGELDDVSRLNRAKVAEVWKMPADPVMAEDQLRALLRRAKAEKLPVSIAGARHSMGGHAIAPDGVAIQMAGFNRMEFDEESGLLTVGAGALWADVIPYLDTRGRSVVVMQAYDSFTVGGSLSVNCHGWQVGKAPFVSTVESFRLMNAEGNILTCSRTENADLFSLASGGYGLFGVILDVRLRVVSNERYRVERAIFPAERYETEFARRVESSPDAEMAFGRLCVVPGEKTFLREAILTSFHRDPAPDGTLPPLKRIADAGLPRAIFRSSIGSDYGKSLRWDVEKNVVTAIFGSYFSRNQLLHNGVDRLQERSADRVEILHESFVPKGQVPAFLDQLRAIIPRHDIDLLNITVRTVRRDDDTILRYADGDMFAFVFLFNQPLTPEADTKLEAATREIIDATLALGGRYYLPYRLHATPDQFRRAYPASAQFFEGKKRHDPTGLFQNGFFRRYGLGTP
ncbi:FAD-binding protein [Zavarzinella formosa]|uniref:FAD-dependent oxidoreductase n=1 Tax=Zavarzinella formosa TaxID=360055 RepID=UPI0002DB351F|nr:FAD-binding oxidoreductase [Zavarzinella formosa]